MTVIAYYLQCAADIVRPVQHTALENHARTALGNASARFRAACVSAETRYFRPLGISFERGVMVITMDVSRAAGGELDATDFVMLDSIGFGAMKSATGKGWSVQELRRRLAPTGTSEDTFSFGEVQEVKRIVGGVTCNPGAIPGPALSNQVVVSGATPGAARQNAPLVPQAITDMPVIYKVGIGVGIGLAAAIGVGYVVRSFK